MDKKDKNWGLINDFITGIGAVLTLVGLYTSVKATRYDQEREDNRLEEKYGLEAINED